MQIYVRQVELASIKQIQRLAEVGAEADLPDDRERGAGGAVGAATAPAGAVPPAAAAAGAMAAAGAAAPPPAKKPRAAPRPPADAAAAEAYANLAVQVGA